MKITPELVVQRYRETGIKPRVGNDNLTLVKGVLEARLPGAPMCAIGIALLGQVTTERILSEVVMTALLGGVQYYAFSDGFDGGENRHGAPEDFELGRACRQAVLDAGYEL